MSGISGEDWKGALTEILEDLETSQFNKMLQFLEKIPKCKKTPKHKDNMAQIIIEHYGLEESITTIAGIMDKIPRRDPVVQDLLRPFLDKLNNNKEKVKRGEKRKRDSEEEDKEKPQAVGQQIHPDAAERQPECRMEGDSEQKKKYPWKKNIVDLNSGCTLKDTDYIVGKVVQKSGLCTYQTEEKRKRFFFYLAVADETDCIKVMVYGKEHYKKIQMGSSYMFRRLLMDRSVVKCTSHSIVSETDLVKVPEQIEEKACSPLHSVVEAKALETGTAVSVEGKVTEIDPVTKKELKEQPKKKKYQTFTLEDETDSIRVSMWGDDVQHCKDVSVGDVVKVTNVKTNNYYGTVSLNSTGFTKIVTVHSVGSRTESMNIMGINKALKTETHLEAEVSKQVHTFIVASPLLAKAFGFKLTGDFKGKLLEELPLSAEAKIKGNRIIDLKKCVNT